MQPAISVVFSVGGCWKRAGGDWRAAAHLLACDDPSRWSLRQIVDANITGRIEHGVDQAELEGEIRELLQDEGIRNALEARQLRRANGDAASEPVPDAGGNGDVARKRALPASPPPSRPL